VKKKVITIASALVVLAAGLVLTMHFGRGEWKGVDESVVEKYATEAGRPPREPFINTDQGDLLLFMFLLAGTVGGFVGGYVFRGLFPPRAKASAEAGTEGTAIDADDADACPPKRPAGMAPKPAGEETGAADDA